MNATETATWLHKMDAAGRLHKMKLTVHPTEREYVVAVRLRQHANDLYAPSSIWGGIVWSRQWNTYPKHGSPIVHLQFVTKEGVIPNRRMTFDTMALACPECGYETPSIEICEEFPTMEDVMEEVEFWLYENHPDFCPNGFTGDDYEEHKYKGEEE